MPTLFLLAVCLGEPPLPAPVAASYAIVFVAAPAVVAPAPKATGGWDLVRIHAPGWHVHKCGACGAEWSHKETSTGSRSDHLCTACGKGPWWTPAATNTRLEMVQVVGRPAEVKTQSEVNSLPIAFSLRQSSQVCPPGGCPPSYSPAPRWRLFR